MHFAQFQMKDLQQAHDNKQAELHSIRKLLNSDDFGERITGDAGVCTAFIETRAQRFFYRFAAQISPASSAQP